MTDPNATPPYDPNQPQDYQQPAAGQPAPGYQQPAPGYQQPGPAQPQYAAPAPLTADSDRLWASLAFFGNILGFIPALIIWLVLKERGPLVKSEGKEALNWGINVTAAFIILQILAAITIFVPFIGILWTLLWIALWVVNIVFSIIGGVRVNGGGSYRYPFNIRWIK